MNPKGTRDELESWLRAAGIEYLVVEEPNGSAVITLGDASSGPRTQEVPGSRFEAYVGFSVTFTFDKDGCYVKGFVGE